jgi:hypothetical protein
MKEKLINGQRPCHFIGGLKTAQLDDSKWEILLDDFQWEYGADTPINVPAGVVSDGGPSVPPYPVFLLGGLVAGVVGGGLLWLFAFPWLSSLPVLSLCAILGVLLGGLIRYRIRPSVFKIVGYLHDYLRVLLTTGNATTDAMLRDAAYWNRPDKLTPFDAWLIYLGVRIGTHTGFKSEPPQSVIDDAIKVFAKHLGVEPSEVEFIPETSLVKLKTHHEK